MDIETSKICIYLRGLSSADAATWLMENYPVEKDEYGYAIKAIAHRSWKKTDQIRLAKYYLDRIPLASASGYETFLSTMSISRFLSVVSEYIPEDRLRVSLLLYYIAEPLRKNTRNSRDEEIVRGHVPGSGVAGR